MEQGHKMVCFGGRTLRSRSVETEIGHKRSNKNQRQTLNKPIRQISRQMPILSQRSVCNGSIVKVAGSRTEILKPGPLD